MRNFIQRALKKLPKLDKAQIHQLLYDLASENERMDVVLDSLSEGVIVSDVNHNLVFYNKFAERLLPFSSQDIYEQRVWDAILDVEISRFVRETLEGQESIVDREFTLESKGVTRTLSCSITPLVRAGHIQGNILHVDDITEKRGREARLRRAESLAALTTLAAGVAHEIKNPLGSIGIHIQLIQKAIKEKTSVDPKIIQPYIEIVNEEVERLNRIVVDFLFAVRPMDTKLEETDLNQVIANLLEFVRYELEEANVTLTEEFDETLPPLMLDEKYVKQAVLNIIKNAISAMPQGGSLVVTTERSGDDAVLRIADSGEGMSDEIMAKIFEPYFTTRDFGSGLGLTLVYKVVKEHMGEIGVSSQEGKGATFRITLPIPQKYQHLLSWEGERQ
ncbi:MAG TPA: ATP-binding protein [Spirochaetia bacterium]|nr:ATP-binding protein [Spirochaetia bacterium]